MSFFLYYNFDTHTLASFTIINLIAIRQQRREVSSVSTYIFTLCMRAFLLYFMMDTFYYKKIKSKMPTDESIIKTKIDFKQSGFKTFNKVWLKYGADCVYLIIVCSYYTFYLWLCVPSAISIDRMQHIIYRIKWLAIKSDKDIIES